MNRSSSGPAPRAYGAVCSACTAAATWRSGRGSWLQRSTARQSAEGSSTASTASSASAPGCAAPASTSVNSSRARARWVNSRSCARSATVLPGRAGRPRGSSNHPQSSGSTPGGSARSRPATAARNGRSGPSAATSLRSRPSSASGGSPRPAQKDGPNRPRPSAGSRSNPPAAAARSTILSANCSSSGRCSARSGPAVRPATSNRPAHQPGSLPAGRRSTARQIRCSHGSSAGAPQVEPTRRSAATTGPIRCRGTVRIPAGGPPPCPGGVSSASPSSSRSAASRSRCRPCSQSANSPCAKR